MVTIVALGGNALIRRGESMSVVTQRRNVRIACASLKPLFKSSRIVVTHGNGPQIGLLALQNSTYESVPQYPLDVLNAETEGMIGYLIEQELANTLGLDHRLATLLTNVEVNSDDPAFLKPVKPIGPQYTEEQATLLRKNHGWKTAADGKVFRRVVSSPEPKRILEIEVIRCLLDFGITVICAGGGGIPNIIDSDGKLRGIEAVIDKDLVSALLAKELDANKLLLLTDVDGVYRNWGETDQKRIKTAHPDSISQLQFADGSMGPKVAAAVQFANQSNGIAGIGSLANARGIAEGYSGTLIGKQFSGISFAD